MYWRQQRLKREQFYIGSATYSCSLATDTRSHTVNKWMMMICDVYIFFVRYEHWALNFILFDFFLSIALSLSSSLGLLFSSFPMHVVDSMYVGLRRCRRRCCCCFFLLEFKHMNRLSARALRNGYRYKWKNKINNNGKLFRRRKKANYVRMCCALYLGCSMRTQCTGKMLQIWTKRYISHIKRHKRYTWSRYVSIFSSLLYTPVYSPFLSLSFFLVLAEKREIPSAFYAYELNLSLFLPFFFILLGISVFLLNI